MMMVSDRLKLRGREHVEAAVALAVVEDLDVVKDLGPEIGSGRPGAAVDELFLERGEEALSDRVIEAIAARSHRLGDAGGAGLLAEGQRDVLGGFNWSSQHLDLGGVDGQACRVDGGVDRAVTDEVAWAAVVAAG